MARYYAKKDRHYGNYTTGQEYMFPDGIEYTGPYHYFGNYELIMTEPFPTEKSLVLKRWQPKDRNRDAIIYDLLTTQNLYEFEPPVHKTPGPGPNDIANGYMMRYFIKQKNDDTKSVIEIDKKQHKAVKKKDGKNINGFLYEKCSLRWKITGPRNDVYYDKDRKSIKSYGIEDTNRRTVYAKNKTMAGISSALRDLTQHSAYSKIRGDEAAGIQKDNLHTDGSEFVLPNGVAYIGFYHIHPSIGPMRGKTHSEKAEQEPLVTPGEYSMQLAKSKNSNSSGY